ncbi:MAG: DUF6474 family protein [Corynebacterium matruchotii]|jgi:hypothetical protein
MGLLKTILKRRAQTKIEVKAAQARARQEIKSAAQLELRRSKLLAAEEKKLLKNESKLLKAQRKHREKMATAELQRLRKGRLNSGKVLRYSAAIRAMAPLLLPLVYKAVVMVRDANTKSRAQQLGVSVDELAQHSGPGADLKARITGMEKSLATYKLPQGFQTDVVERLQALQIAVENADRMSPDQRKRAHRTISADLDELNKEVLARLL